MSITGVIGISLSNADDENKQIPKILRCEIEISKL